MGQGMVGLVGKAEGQMGWEASPSKGPGTHNVAWGQWGLIILHEWDAGREIL